MGFKSIVGWVLKLPLILLILATLGVGIYAAMGKVPGFIVSWSAPGFIALLIILYAVGNFLLKSDRLDNESDLYMETSEDQQEKTF